MEKILEFKKAEPDIPMKVYRFQCDCLSVECAMDIDVEGVGNKDKDKFITLRLDMPTDFSSRVRLAFNILFKGWAWREFIPRKTDYKYISRIFNDKSYTELP